MAAINIFCEMAIEDTAKQLAIKFPNYPELAETFKSVCIKESFDELELLIDDVCDGFDESNILEAIAEEIEINKDDKTLLCIVMHNAFINFSPPPTTLNLVEIDTTIDKKEIDEMSEQANLGFSTRASSILNVLVIGKRNHFPLLIYLVDTYCRWRFVKYNNLYKVLNKYQIQSDRQQFIGQYFKMISENDFFNECPVMRQLNQTSHNVFLWYRHSISHFFRKGSLPLNIHPKRIQYVINDSLILYAKYFIAILHAVNNIINSPAAKLPLQIDFWVIPKAMAVNVHNNSDSDADDETDDDDDAADEQTDDKKQQQNNNNDFKSRINLKLADNMVELEITNREIFHLSSTFFGIYERIIENQRSKRMVIVIDRSINGEDVVENNKNYSQIITEEKTNADKLYAFLPKNYQNIASGQYLHESLFGLTQMDDTILYSDMVYGYNACLLSVHLHSENIIRCYHYFNGSMSRFFIKDMIDIWPLLFIHDKIDKENGVAILQDTTPIMRLISDNRKNIPIKDANFNIFFQQNTGINPIDSWIFRLTKEQTKERAIKIIHGYIREINNKYCKLTIPKDLNMILVDYYCEFEDVIW